MLLFGIMLYIILLNKLKEMLNHKNLQKIFVGRAGVQPTRK